MSSQIPDTRPTYVRLTEAQRERLAEIARRENRTLSGEIRHAIERRLAEDDERSAA